MSLKKREKSKSRIMGVLMASVAVSALQISPLSINMASAALDEIVVTAQKREEGLQDTPIAISAYSGEAIEKTNVSNISEVANFAPNVSFDFTSPVSGASNAAAITIRGIGQTDFALTTEAGVGTYVDGVYMSRSIGGVLDVLDIERLEVLRGPQGTLFGRNSVGGAISIVSRKPGDEVSGFFDISGGNYSRLHLRGSVDLPVSDNFGVRVSASSKNRDGYVKSLTEPGWELGNEDRQAVRAVAVLDATPDFEIMFTADYSRIREQNAASILRGTTSRPGTPVGAYNVLAGPPTGMPAVIPYDDRWVTGNFDTTYANGPNGTEIDAWGTSLILDWDLLDNLTVKSISAYRESEGFFNRDADGSPLQMTHTTNPGYYHDQFSQELQVIGDFADERLKYVAGVYYFSEEGSDPVIVPIGGDADTVTFGTVQIMENDIENDSMAAYVQFTGEITDALSLTAGVRYTRDEKEFHTDQFLETGLASLFIFGAPAGFEVPLVPRDSTVSNTFNDISPRVSVDYTWGNGVLTYASYSQGFKSGGFNLRYVLPRPEVLTFAPEDVDTYEVGVKFQGFDDRLRVNAAGFHTKYDGIQLTTFELGGAPVTDNAGEVELWGAELEIAAVPVDNFELGLNVGYLSHEYVGLNADAVTNTPFVEQQITLNTSLPNAPEWTINFNAEYVFPLANSGEIALRGDWFYSSEVENDAQNSVFLHEDGYDIGNASLTYTAPGEGWEVYLFVDNITDERYLVSGDSNYGIGFHEANVNRPREYGGGIRVRF